MTSQRMKAYFIKKKIHLKFIVVCDQHQCDLPNMTIKILIANVICNYKLVIGTNCKMSIFYQCGLQKPFTIIKVWHISLTYQKCLYSFVPRKSNILKCTSCIKWPKVKMELLEILNPNAIPTFGGWHIFLLSLCIK